MDFIINLISKIHNFYEREKYIFNILPEYNIITQATKKIGKKHKYMIFVHLISTFHSLFIVYGYVNECF